CTRNARRRPFLNEYSLCLHRKYLPQSHGGGHRLGSRQAARPRGCNGAQRRSGRSGWKPCNRRRRARCIGARPGPFGPPVAPAYAGVAGGSGYCACNGRRPRRSRCGNGCARQDVPPAGVRLTRPDAGRRDRPVRRRPCHVPRHIQRPRAGRAPGVRSPGGRIATRGHMSALPGRLVLLGHPVAHSRSPAFQNAALRSAGLPLVYEAMDVPPSELAGVVRQLELQNAAGNVTVPHKEAVAQLCARVSNTAARAGAVNTFRTEGGSLVGDNTDVAGFNALARHVAGSEPRKAQIALLGAGGAAAAALVAMDDWVGCTISLFSRRRDRAQQLVERLASSARPTDSVQSAVSGAGIVINATPLGIAAGDELPVPISELPAGALVIDLNYA